MRKFSTLVDFLNSKTTNPSNDDLVSFSGYSSEGDGGAATWKFNGLTGQTPSQSPADLGDALLNDASGNQWGLVIEGEVLSTKTLGSVSDFATDDSLVIIAGNTFCTSNNINLYIDNCATSQKLNLNCDCSGDLKFVGAAINDHIVEYDSVQNRDIDKLNIDGNDVDNGVKALINLKNCVNVNVRDGVYTNAHSLGISVVGGSDCDIERNKLTKNITTGAEVNIGINISDATTIPKNINIEGNETSGFAIQVRGFGCTILNNKIHDWEFGGGVAMTQPDNIGLEDSYGNHKILFNEIYNSTGIDVDLTPPAGVECSQSRCEIALNTIYNMAGEGITSASKFSKIHNNDCYDNGSEPTASVGNRDGIHLRTLTASSGTDQKVSDNKCYDTRSGGSRTQLNGIRVNDDVDRASLVCNELYNNASGDYVLPVTKGVKVVSLNGAVNNFGGNISISSGAIATTFGSYQLDTEGAAPSDDLDTITGSGVDGEILILGLVSAARTVTIKNATGNIRTKTGADLTLTTQYQIITLYFRNGTWIEV